MDPLSRTRELIDLGAALATAGRRDLALALLDEAEAVVRAHAERMGRWLGSALMGAGAPERAEALARSLTDPLWRVWLLTEVGRAVAGRCRPPADNATRPRPRASPEPSSSRGRNPGTSG